MCIYIGYILLVGIQTLLFNKGGKLNQSCYKKKKYLFLCCVELVVLAGVRDYTVGADTSVYLSAIDYYSDFSNIELLSAKQVYPFVYEVGYFWLMKLCVFLELGKTGFLFVIALAIYIPLFIFVNKYSSSPYLSIVTYFAFGYFSYSLGLFRQMIAISILFCGIKYIEERKFVKYLLIVIVAMSFHFTSLIGIGLYFLYKIKKKKNLFWLFLVELGLLLFGRNIIEFIIKLIPQYSGYVGSVYDTQGGSYLMLIILNLILIANNMICAKNNNSLFNLTNSALILAVCFQCLGYSMGIFGRVVTYFSIYNIVVIPNIVNIFAQKYAKNGGIVYFAAIVFLLIFAYIEFNGNNYVVPYHTIFCKKIFDY